MAVISSGEMKMTKMAERKKMKASEKRKWRELIWRIGSIEGGNMKMKMSASAMKENMA